VEKRLRHPGLAQQLRRIPPENSFNVALRQACFCCGMAEGIDFLISQAKVVSQAHGHPRHPLDMALRHRVIVLIIAVLTFVATANAVSYCGATPHFVDSEAGRRGRFGVAIGGAAVIGLGDVGPAILPVMRLSLAISPSLVAQLAMAGYGSQASVQDDVGSARVAEEFALLGACYRFILGRHLRPTVSLAAGVLHTRAEGEATSAYRGHDAALWSFLLDGGVGVGLALAGGFEVAFATHAQIADPYPAIRFARSVVATSARPSLLFTLTIGAWL